MKPPVDPNTYLEGGEEYRRLALTHGQYALVDSSDHAELAAHNWSAKWANGTKTYYVVREENGRQVFMHRTILAGTTRVDHRNGNTLDNRRANLRPASRAENGRNRKLHANNKTGYRGVTVHKPGIWKAFGSDGQGGSVYLGCRPSPEEAARLYDEWARAHYLEFARLNFPDLERAA